MKFWEHDGKLPYYCVGLCKNGKTKNKLVHRLVAEAFIPNPKNLEQVNHKDGNPHNNRVDNLEWVTNAENTIHAYKNHLRKKRVIWIFDGENYISLLALCNRLNLNYKKVHYRLKRLNWDFEKAIDNKGGGKYVMCETLPTSRKCVS